MLIGRSDTDLDVKLDLSMANRHGLITGATGTGKTVTMQLIAEQFSRAGVPVFAADVKGDLSGIAGRSVLNEKISSRLDKLGITNFTPQACPTLFWDVFGKNGHPLRVSVSEMGPLLLGRTLDLNETQQGVLELVFSIADDQGLLILDLKDLTSMLRWIQDDIAEIKKQYGFISGASLGAIQRKLHTLGEAGGEILFAEPVLNLKHIMQTDFSGNGVISLLNASDLIEDPRLYSMLLLWLLSELFEQLEEVGDPERPRLVFFFDEAHLLFNNANSALIEKIEQVVRLIRSKGVGVFFVTQSPSDIPETVLAQLGNRVQHALRAYTPNEQKRVKAAAKAFVQNPQIDTEQAIMQLGVGEALVSVLDQRGIPTMVQRVLVAPPASKIGPISDEVRKEVFSRSPLAGVYEAVVDRESAYEILAKRRDEIDKVREQEEEKSAAKKSSGGSRRQSISEAFIKSVARSIGSALGRKLIRGMLGTLVKGS